MNINKFYKDNGYLELEVITSDLCDIVNEKIERLIDSGDYKENTKIYKYNDSPRIIESWKYIPEIIDIANSSEIISTLTKLYGRKPLPFSTINFIKGSNQPLHSDYVHFGSIPEGFLCGVWIALEDIQEGSGELQVGLGTNDGWPIFRYADHGLKKPGSLSDIKKNYSYYEDWVKEKVSNEKTEIKKCYLKKGQALFWDHNLLHGGAKVTNSHLTRKSLVIHYHFDKTIAYNPNFSFYDGDNYEKRHFKIIGETNE